MARLVIAAGKRQGHAVELGGAPVFVGRLAACELPIEEAQASRKHFAVEPRGDGWIVRDLESKNGVHLNDTRVKGEAPLGHGDELRVGDTVVRFEAPELARRAGIGPGAVLGPYEVGEAIARTVEGTIYRARHGSLDRPARVLALAPELAPGAKERAAFLARARAVAAFDHAGLLAVLDAGEEGERAWAVTEDFEGEPLHVVLERAPPSPAEAIAILSSVAAALGHIHGRGGVHGRVGPASILVASGRAKLAFPIADGSPRLDLEAKNALERARWASPEEARGLEATKASDVWSLGVLAFRLLAGELPWSSKTLPELLRELASGDEVPSLRGDDLPDEVATLVARLLAKGGADRPGAAAVAAELTAVAGLLSRPKPRPTPPPRSAPPKPGSRSGAKARKPEPQAAPEVEERDGDEAEGEGAPPLDPVRALAMGLLVFLLFVASTKATRLVLAIVDPPPPAIERRG